MHDPKLIRPSQPDAARYQMDATPGRHTASFGPDSFRTHIINSAGLCLFSGFVLLRLNLIKDLLGFSMQ